MLQKVYNWVKGFMDYKVWKTKREAIFVDINSTTDLLSYLNHNVEDFHYLVEYDDSYPVEDWYVTWNHGSMSLHWPYMDDKKNAEWVAALFMHLWTVGLDAGNARDLASNHVYVQTDRCKDEVVDKLNNINITIPPEITKVGLPVGLKEIELTPEAAAKIEEIVNNPDIVGAVGKEMPSAEPTVLTNEDMVKQAYASWNDKTSQYEAEKNPKKQKKG